MDYCVNLTILLLCYLGKLSASEDSAQYDINDARQLYDTFVLRYNRTFHSEKEYHMRYQNFVQTLRNINRINSQSKMEQKVVPNMFADFSNAERRRILQRTTKNIEPELKAILRIEDKPDPKHRKPGKMKSKKQEESKVLGDREYTKGPGGGIRTYDRKWRR